MNLVEAVLRRNRRPDLEATKVITAVEVEFNLEIHLSEEPVDGYYLADAKPLGVSAFGETPEDALHNIVDALNSRLAALTNNGDLIAEFQRRNVRYTEQRVMSRPLQPNVAVRYCDAGGIDRPAFGHALVPC